MIRIPLPYSDWLLLVSPRFAFLGTPWQHFLLFFLAVVPLFLLVWLYRREMRLLRPAFAVALLGLRLLLLAVIWSLVTMQPIVARMGTLELPGRIVVLLDRSMSMDVTDPQRSEAERRRLAKALHLSTKAGDWNARIEKLTRGEIARMLLTSEGRGLLRELGKKHHVEVLAFHKGVWQIPAKKFGDKALVPGHAEHALGRHYTDLRLALQRGGQSSSSAAGKLIAVLLLTDGRHNRGETPVALAAKLGRREIPIYPIPLGAKNTPPDVSLLAIDAPATVLKDTDAPVNARIHVSGLPAQEIQVELQHGESPVRKEHKKTIRHDGEDRTYSVRFSLPMKESGSQDFRVRVNPVAKQTKEISRDNNEKSTFIRVAEDKAKILLVDGESRWEHHYVAEALRRDDAMEPKSVLFAQPRLAISKSADSIADGRPVQKFPIWDKNKDEPDPLEKYAAVVLGDVSPDQLPLPDRQRLERYVSDFGGTLIVVAGKRWMPQAFSRQWTDKGDPEPLAAMLPIVFPRAIHSQDGFKVTLTGDGDSRSYLQLEATPQASRETWGKLPPHYFAVVGKAKPGAVSLAYVPGKRGRVPFAGTARRVLRTKGTRPLFPAPSKANEIRKKENPERERSLIALQNYGFGKVLYVGLDSTWRWRFRRGDLYHHRFWGQVVRWAASDKVLPAGNKYVRYGARKPAWSQETPVEIDVRLQSGVKPLPSSAKAKARILRQENKKEIPVANVELQVDERQPRLLKGNVRELPPGKYRIELDIPALKDKLPARTKTSEKNLRDGFLVLPAGGGELLNLSVDWRLLQTVASKSGGEVIPPDRADELVRRLKKQTLTEPLRRDQKLWQDSPAVWYMLGVVVVLLTLEWGTRKIAGLP